VPDSGYWGLGKSTAGELLRIKH